MVREKERKKRRNARDTVDSLRLEVLSCLYLCYWHLPGNYAHVYPASDMHKQKNMGAKTTNKGVPVRQTRQNS